MLAAITPGFLTGATAKTYDDFVAHITARGVDGDQAWNALVNINAGSYTTQAGTVGSSTMRGSSWLAKFAGDGAITRGVARVVQHGLPSQAIFNDQVAQARKVFLVVAAVTADFPVALNRNGYLSTGDNVNTSAIRACTELTYWYSGAAWTMNPSTGTGPTPYPIP